MSKVVLNSTPKGDAKKAKIIEATIRCIANYGIEKTSFEKVGKEAGITKAHVNYYFKEKSDLLRATLEFVRVNAQEVTTAHLGSLKTPESIVKGINDVSFKWAEDFPEHVAVLGLMHYYCIVNPKFKDFNTQARNTARERMAEALAIHRPDLSARELKKLAYSVNSLITGFILESSTSDLEASLKQLKKDCLKSIEALIASA